LRLITNSLINQLENINNQKNKETEIVAISTKGKKLTKAEYRKKILEICEKTDKGNFKTSDEVFDKYLVKYKRGDL